MCLRWQFGFHLYPLLFTPSDSSKNIISHWFTYPKDKTCNQWNIYKRKEKDLHCWQWRSCILCMIQSQQKKPIDNFFIDIGQRIKEGPVTCHAKHLQKLIFTKNSLFSFVGLLSKWILSFLRNIYKHLPRIASWVLFKSNYQSWRAYWITSN